MKKALFMFAVAAMFFGAASCRKEIFDNGFVPELETRIDCTDDPMKTIRVYIKTEDTRMAFEENQDKRLHRDWEVGDIIDGCSPVICKNQSTIFESFQYMVSETGYDTEKGRNYIVLEKHSGKAGVPSAEKGTPVHFVYAPGAVSFNKEDGACMLDISNQTEEIPAVMTASGVVGDESEGKRLDLEFEYVAAVIKIVNPQLKENDGETPVTGTIGINKVSVSAMTKGVMNLVEDGKQNCRYELDGTSVEPGIASAYGNCQTDPVFVAVLPGTCNIDATIFASVDENQENSACFQFYSESEITFKSGDYKGISNKSFLRMDDYVAAIWNNNEGFYEYFSSFDVPVEFANGADRDVAIEMMMDTDLSSGVTIENVNGKITTLNLNGCTISYSGADASAITAKTELVVNDAKNKGGIKAVSCALRANTGVLTINGGTFEGNGYRSGGTGVVYSYGEGSKLTINGGVIKCNCRENEGRAVNVRKDSFIYGGTIICNGAGYALRQSTDGTCTVDGEKVVVYSNSKAQSPVSATGASRIDFINGYVYADSDKDVINDGSKVVVTGGHFNKAFVAGVGYECVEKVVIGPDGRKYTHTAIMGKATPVAEVTAGGSTTGYLKFEEAMTAALNADGAILRLLNDCNLAVEMHVDKSLTVDLNGFTLYANKMHVDLKSSDVTITDGSSGAGGEYIYDFTGGNAFDVQYGILTFAKGTITSRANAANIKVGTGGVFHMTGGKLQNVYTSTSSSNNVAALQLAGGVATIDGGILISDAYHVIYVNSKQSKLYINGGAFIAKSSGKYPIYCTTNNCGHKVTVTDEKSEPLFVGFGTTTANKGRALYASDGSGTKIDTKAGLFTGSILGKVEAPDTHVAEGYKREAVSEKRTIGGVEYTFVMRVVKN